MPHTPTTHSTNKKNTKDPYDIHYRYHQVLGHVTTIRVAIWQLKQSTHLTAEDQSVIKVAEAHVEKLVDEIDQLKQQCYKLIE